MIVKTAPRGAHTVSRTAVIAGVRRDATEVYIGKARLLRAVMRISPTLGYRMLRDG